MFEDDSIESTVDMLRPQRVSSIDDAQDVSSFLLTPGLFGTPLTPGEHNMFLHNPLQSVDHPVDVCWFCRDSEGAVSAVLGMRQHANQTGIHEVYAFAVDPSHRDQGLGRQLLERGMRHVSEVGGRGLIVDTSSHPSYEPMHLLLRSMGFEQVGRFPGFYYPGEDCCWYFIRVDRDDHE